MQLHIRTRHPRHLQCLAYQDLLVESQSCRPHLRHCHPPDSTEPARYVGIPDVRRSTKKSPSHGGQHLHHTASPFSLARLPCIARGQDTCGHQFPTSLQIVRATKLGSQRDLRDLCRSVRSEKQWQNISPDDERRN